MAAIETEPVWSLSVEIIGYIVFPVLSWQIGHIQSTRIAIAVGALSLAALLALELLRHEEAVNNIDRMALIRTSACFIGGVALCKWWREACSNRMRGGPYTYQQAVYS